jgi:hypothetical protein
VDAVKENSLTVREVSLEFGVFLVLFYSNKFISINLTVRTVVHVLCCTSNDTGTIPYFFFDRLMSNNVFILW